MGVSTDIECGMYEFEGEQIPALSASASRSQDGTVHLSLCNLDPNWAIGVSCEVRGVDVTHVAGRVLTAEQITAHNTFDEPQTVRPTRLEGTALEDDTVLVRMPSGSVGGRVLTAGQMQAHVVVDELQTARPARSEGLALEDGKVLVRMPSKSVVVLAFRDE